MAADTYTISASTGGTVDPTGVQAITENTDVTATETMGYALQEWLLDTVSVGFSNPYTIVYVGGETHTLEASFTPRHHTRRAKNRRLKNRGR